MGVAWLIVREPIGRRKAKVTGWPWNSWGVDSLDACLLVWIRVIFTSSIMFCLASALAAEGVYSILLLPVLVS